jgi:hypothetical protein
MRTALAITLLCGLLLAVGWVSNAGAVIHPASVLDGPANDILELDGTAMAPDGSGGIVYRKNVAGVAHVFAVQFADGHWNSPVQVDGGDPYGASTPAIAAGDGGRLLVVWVQPRNISPKGVAQYALMGASLQPGASTFGQAIIVDANVGEPLTGDISGVEPALAMNPTSGAAYVVYRAITDDCSNIAGDPPNSSCPPAGSSEKLLDVRVARFDYLRWSSPAAVNRAAQIALRNPTPSNAPAVGIDLSGNGVVAWQEPDSEGVARIWVRRLFGTVLGNVLQASPSAVSGRQVSSDADAPAVAVGPFGEALIAYRILGGSGSAVPTTQLFLNSISSEVAPHGSQLQGASPLAGAAVAGIGPPSAAIDAHGAFRLAWTQAGAVQELSGEGASLPAPVAIGAADVPTGAGAGGAGGAGGVPTTINPAGGGTSAWPGSAAGQPVVDVREDYAQGAFQSAQLAGDLPGPVGGLQLGGDGQGDALLGWTQGPPGQSEVVGDFVQAPPALFQVQTPAGWVRGGSAAIGWEAAPDAVAGVTYSVYVDGRARVRGLTGLAVRLPAKALGDGTHHVQVLASDGAGQQTMSPASELKVDANPPIVRYRLFDHGRGVRVTVRDAASGVAASATRISFGDGHSSERRDTVTHIYRPGVYTIQATVRDRVGNHASVYLRVRAR